MRLAAYLKRERIKIADFAAKISVHEKSVSRYLGGRVPSTEVLKRIVSVTKGEVTANDFFSADDEEEQQGCAAA